MELGRPGDAQDARAACERSIAIREALIKAAPGVPWFRHALGASLQQRGQVRWSQGDFPGAAADIRRALTIFSEYPAGIGDEAVIEACCHAELSGLARVAGSGVSAAEGVAEAEAAMALLRRAIAGGYRDVSTMREPAFDSLRARADFQSLMLDLTFPHDPFAH
jgi:hypothetical protein